MSSAIDPLFNENYYQSNAILLNNQLSFNNPHKYTCCICFSEFSISKIAILKCGHYICNKDMILLIKNSINSGTYKLKCFNIDCNYLLQMSEIHIYCDKITWHKYEKLMIKNIIDESSDYTWCPRPGCDYAISLTSAFPFVECLNPECKLKFCFYCKDNWHDNMTCEKYQLEQKLKYQHSVEDNKSLKWCNINTKLCPKCKIKIQRNGGCDEMKCSRCKFKFYWYNANSCNETYVEIRPGLKPKSNCNNWLDFIKDVSGKILHKFAKLY